MDIALRRRSQGRIRRSGLNDRSSVRGLDLAARLTAGRALDAGPLASARALEGLTAVLVNLNKRYKARAGFRVTGLP
jgi:predicted dinucleotide-binding enzyme